MRFILRRNLGFWIVYLPSSLVYFRVLISLIRVFSLLKVKQLSKQLNFFFYIYLTYRRHHIKLSNMKIATFHEMRKKKSCSLGLFIFKCVYMQGRFQTFGSPGHQDFGGPYQQRFFKKIFSFSKKKKKTSNENEKRKTHNVLIY